MSKSVKCHWDGCQNTIALHKWNKIRKQWFFTKGGYAYCPDHIPAWAPEWRASRLSEAK